MSEQPEFSFGKLPFATGYVANRHAPQPDPTSKWPLCALCRRSLVRVNPPGREPFLRHERYTFTRWSGAD